MYITNIYTDLTYIYIWYKKILILPFLLKLRWFEISKHFKQEKKVLYIVWETHTVINSKYRYVEKNRNICGKELFVMCTMQNDKNIST